MALIMFENTMMPFYTVRPLPIRNYHRVITLICRLILIQRKKEKQRPTEKARLKTEETEADPIPFALYQDICMLSVESKNFMYGLGRLVLA